MKKGKDPIAGWAERARQALATQGLSYTDVTESLGVLTPSAVGHYLADRRELSARQAVSLAGQLKCSVQWLLVGEMPVPGVRTRSNAAAPATMEAVSKVLQRLHPELFAAIGRVIIAIGHERAPRRKKRSTG